MKEWLLSTISSIRRGRGLTGIYDCVTYKPLRAEYRRAAVHLARCSGASLFLRVDFLQIFNGQFRCEGVKDHVIPSHCFDGRLPHDFGTGLVCIIMPIAIDVADPVEYVLIEHFAGDGKAVASVGDDLFEKVFFAHPLHPVVGGIQRFRGGGEHERFDEGGAG